METHYTPEIGEFHVGFEYEIMELGSRTKYNPTTLNEWDDLTGDYDGRTLLYEIARGGQSVRVKYLDREDIESLGFVFKGGDTRLTYHYGGYAISHTPSNNKIDIYYYDGSEFVNAITIQNKSELKRLLKQLNIL